MRVRIALLAATWSVSACVLFPSLDDLGGDAGADASPADAVAEPAPDAAPEASAVDAALDAPPDADAAPTPFCTEHATATFCADFDESPDAGAGFTSIYLTDGGVVSLDTGNFSSSPASLLAGSATLASGASAHAAVVEHTGATPATSVTLDYALYVDHLPSQGSYVESLALVFESATQSSIQFNVKTASAEVGEELDAADGGKRYVGHALASPLATGTWMHVTLALAMTAPRTITASLDGNVVLDHVAMDAAFTAGPVDLYLGNAYSPGPSDGASLHYDDVVLSVE